MTRVNRTRKEQGQDRPRLGEPRRAKMTKRQGDDDQHNRTRRTRMTRTKETKTWMAGRPGPEELDLGEPKH
mgnify:CR=1 FL=1